MPHRTPEAIIDKIGEVQESLVKYIEAVEKQITLRVDMLEDKIKGLDSRLRVLENNRDNNAR